MNSKYEMALAMRESGSTYREIGEALGVSPTRAQQIYARARRFDQESRKWYAGLPTMVSNAIVHFTLWPDPTLVFQSKEQVKVAIECGDLALDTRDRSRKGASYKGRTMHNIGTKGFEQLAKWCGASVPEVKRRPKKRLMLPADIGI